jgi:hypothetical protein
VVGVIVNLRMVTTVKALVRILVDLSHDNGHLVFLTKDKTHDVSLLKKAGSTVLEYFEWDLPKVLSQGGAGLLSMLITEGSPQSLMWLSPTEMLLAKGSSQNLVRSSMTRIVNHYMTLFLVLHHERIRYCKGLLKPRQ